MARARHQPATILDAIGTTPLLRLRSRASANGAELRRLEARLGPDAVVVTLAVDTAFEYLSARPLSDL